MKPDHKPVPVATSSAPTPSPAPVAAKAAVADIIPDEKILTLNLGEIFVDYNWNARKRADVDDISDAVRDTTSANGHAEGADIAAFAAGIRLAGQDTPVVVRHVPKGGRTLGGQTTNLPYELVAGFRRYTAITMLNGAAGKDAARQMGLGRAVKNLPDGTINAVVRVLSPKEARLLNVRENTARNNLKTPDLVLQVADLYNVEMMTQTEIGTGLGITQSFVSKLLAVSKLPKEVLLHWRNGNESPIPGLPTTKIWPRVLFTDLLVLANLGDMPKAAAISRYVQMINPESSGEDENTSNGATDAKAKKALDRVTDFATMVGKLVALGVVEEGNLNWNKVIGPKKSGFLIDSGSGEVAHLMTLTDAASDAYDKAVTGEPVTKA